MPSIFKFYEENDSIKDYEFDLISFEPEPVNDPLLDEDGELIEPEPEQIDKELVELSKRYQNDYGDKAKAKDILELAREEAENIRADAYKEATAQGYDEGYRNGYEKAIRENREKLDGECRRFLKDLESAVHSVEKKRDELLLKYRDDLKNIAVAVAEKVIQVSLKSSGDVIERMIITSTEKLKSKSWAKIYIAKCDADLLVEGDKELLSTLSHLSEHVKIISMENENHGTCIIELPDEILDASANTQVENIKEILNNAGI